MVGHAPLHTHYLRFLESTIWTHVRDDESKDPNDEILRKRRDDRIPEKEETTVVKQLEKVHHKRCRL